jgi:hypothetical protein
MTYSSSVMNPLRSIIMPLLLLTAVVAVGVYYYRMSEGFGNRDDNYAPNGQWTSSISSSIRDCTQGVLVAQIQNGLNKEYYPFCFPNGVTNADNTFNNTNKSVSAYSKKGTVVTFYSDVNATGDIVGSLPQNGEQNGQFLNMQFKSIRVIMPESTSRSGSGARSGSGSGARSGSGRSGSGSGRSGSGSGRSGSGARSDSGSGSGSASCDYPDNLLANSKASLSLDFEYDGEKSYLSKEHEEAHRLQAEELSKMNIKNTIYNELLSELGKGTGNRVSYDEECDDECDEDTPAAQQGCAAEEQKEKYAKKKDNIPCWGCN